MTDSTPMLIAAVSFFVTTGAMVLVCANAHIDFFPCEQTVRTPDSAQLKTEAATCSLMDHLREPIDGEKDELTGAGWALLAAFCMSIGVADSALIYTVLSRKSKLA